VSFWLPCKLDLKENNILDTLSKKEPKENQIGAKPQTSMDMAKCPCTAMQVCNNSS